MPFSTIAAFIKSFPGIKSLTPSQQKKALDIFNALKREGMEDGRAIAVAITRAKKLNENMKKNVFTLSQIFLEEGEKCSKVEVLRVGVIRDRNWKITKEMLNAYVKNHKDNVYGTEVQVNLEHNRGSEAAGWVTDLYMEGKSLYASVDWTELGIDKITKKLFKFVSAELALEYPHHESGDLIQNVFIGLALTNTPALKGQNALSLSEIQETNSKTMFKKFIELLSARAYVSKEEKETMRAMLAELPEEEQAEAKAQVEEVEAKPEEKVLTPEEEAAKKAAEEAEAAQKVADEAAAEEARKAAEAAQQNLSEAERETIALKERVQKLEEEKLRMELGSTVAPFMLSETNKKGFVEAKSKEKLVNLLTSLSENARTEVLSLLAEVLQIELGEKGSTKVEAIQTPEQKLEEQKTRAAKLASEKGMPMHEALSQVIVEDESKNNSNV